MAAKKKKKKKKKKGKSIKASKTVVKKPKIADPLGMGGSLTGMPPLDPNILDSAPVGVRPPVVAQKKTAVLKPRRSASPCSGPKVQHSM